MLGDTSMNRKIGFDCCVVYDLLMDSSFDGFFRVVTGENTGSQTDTT